MTAGSPGRVRPAVVERVLAVVSLLVCAGMVVLAGTTSKRAVADEVRPIPRSSAVPAPSSSSPPDPCRDDGTSGKRILALYVHGDRQENRYLSTKATFRERLARVDREFTRAAAVNGGGRRQVRLVRDRTCAAIVEDVAIAQIAMDTPDTIAAALQVLGYDRTDRKYIVWYDRAGCGKGFGAGGNDLPDWYNLYNFGPYYATLGTDCWGWAATLRELLKGLGAAGGDYSNFNTGPAPRSPLRRHWNVADSDFLDGRSTRPDPPLTSGFRPTPQSRD
jgi:hypothetical protein